MTKTFSKISGEYVVCALLTFGLQSSVSVCVCVCVCRPTVWVHYLISLPSERSSTKCTLFASNT